MSRDKTVKKWQKRVSDWKQSGLLQTHFCRKYGIDTSDFSKWKKRVESESDTANSELSTKFVSIPVSLSETAFDTLKLHIGNRYVIEIPNGFNPAELKNIIRAIENTP